MYFLLDHHISTHTLSYNFAVFLFKKERKKKRKKEIKKENKENSANQIDTFQEKKCLQPLQEQSPVNIL